MPRGHILDLRWNALLNEFRRSGLTHAEFCQRRGISIHSFRKRLYPMFGVTPPGSAALTRENALFSRSFANQGPSSDRKV